MGKAEKNAKRQLEMELQFLDLDALTNEEAETLFLLLKHFEDQLEAKRDILALAECLDRIDSEITLH